MTTDLYGLLPDEIATLVTEFGEPAYRAKQILQSLYRDFAPSIDAMTTLPAALRRRLVEAGYDAGTATETTRSLSADGETTKLLLGMEDRTLIETVLMQYPDASGERRPRSTVCVSTQAGCAMGCVFCATGQMGFERNLTVGEIVAQVIHVARLLRERDERVTNVVFMGMGEPLANYGSMLTAVRLLTDARAFGLAQRAVTISTVGLVHAIDRLAGEDLQVGLAISLHAADEGLRQQLVPTAGPYSVDELVAAAARYFATTGRRVTFEYALLAGINDGSGQAEALARLLRGSGTHVNLIPVNPTAGGFQRPPRERVLAFERVLREAGIACTVRVEKGSAIAAACGQLRTDASGTSAAARHGRRQGTRGQPPSRAR